MLLASRTRKRTALLPLLLALCAVCLWPASRTLAAPVRVKLVVYALDASSPDALPRPVDGAELSLPRAGFGDVTGKTEGGGHFEAADRDFDLEKQNSYELTVKAAGFEEKKIKITANDLNGAVGKELTVFALLTKSGQSHAAPADNAGNGNVGGSPILNVKTGGNQTGNGAATPPDGRSSLGQAFDWTVGTMVWIWLNGLWWLGLLVVVLVASTLLVWRRYGLRPSFVRSGPQGDILQHFLSITNSLKEMAKTQNETYKLVESLPSKISNGPAPAPSAASTQNIPGPSARGWQASSGGARPAQAEERTTSQMRSVASQTAQGRPDLRESVEPPVPQTTAAGAYSSLVGGRGGGIEPLYLNAESKGSLTDILEDGPVYLCEVSHTQGTFVLFPEGEKSGWVFPNPGLMFREQALRPVFPALTESEFNDRKDGIKPRPASKVGEGRWKLEGS